MPRDRIQSILARERRDALLESFVTSLLYLFAAVILTLIAHFFLMVIGAMLMGFIPMFRGSLPRFIGPQIFSVAIMLLIALISRRRLFDDEFDLAHGFELNLLFGVWRGDIRDFGEGIAAILSLVIIGPRCAVLSFKAARLFLAIGFVDIEKLRGPIEFALNRRRKISQPDMPGIKIEYFLKQTTWLKGVVPLYSEPIGFVLSSAFRSDLKGEAIPEPEENEASDYTYHQNRRRSGPYKEPKLPCEESVSDTAWAYSVLELPMGATAEEIKFAYRRLAKIYHPDVCHTPEAASKMKELNLAKEILGSA